MKSENKVIEFEISQELNQGKFQISTKYMETYHFVIIHLGFHKFSIGRPIIPIFLFFKHTYKNSWLYKSICYYQSLKKQIDLYFTPVGNLKKEWEVKTDILELKLKLPNFICRYLENKVEKYYKTQSKIHKYGN